MSEELTAKQRAFIEALPVNAWNGTKAAIAAGYSIKSAHVTASKLLDNPKIAEELEKRKAEIAEKTDVEVSEIIAALCLIAFGGTKATNTEKLRALELLGKYKGMFVDVTRHEDRQQSALSAERRAELAENARKAANAPKVVKLKESL